jgi:alcohol dehydrogenase class IV
VAFHIPHGLSNAVLLPTVTRFSVDAAPARYATVARTIGCAQQNDSDAVANAALIDWLEQLNRSLELPRLADCRNVTRARFDELLNKMASDALASGSPNNNPRVPTADEIVALYKQAW